jgi:type II secretory pathway pseudopilin PulG
MLKNNKGMALPLVIVVMLIVSILGLTLLQVAFAQTTHAARDKSRMQAYYLAKAGVEATEKWLLNNTDKFNNIKDKTSSPTTLPDSGINGTFTVKVSGSLDNIVLLEGTGTVNGVNATATKALISSGDILNEMVFDDTVYAKNIVILSGNVTINGSVGYGVNMTSNGSVNITGTSGQKDKNMPSPIFPADPSTSAYTYDSGPDRLKSDTTLNILAGYNNSERMLVSRTFYFNVNNGTLTVNTGSAGSVVRLVTENFDFGGGSLVLTGSGRFELYVTKDMKLGAGVELNEGGSAKRFLVLLGEGATFDKAGGASFTGVIYGPEAQLKIAGTSNFTGAVIGDNTTISGNPFASSGDAGDLNYDDLPIAVIEKSNYINN